MVWYSSFFHTNSEIHSLHHNLRLMSHTTVSLMSDNLHHNFCVRRLTMNFRELHRNLRSRRVTTTDDYSRTNHAFTTPTRVGVEGECED